MLLGMVEPWLHRFGTVQPGKSIEIPGKEEQVFLSKDPNGQSGVIVITTNRPTNRLENHPDKYRFIIEDDKVVKIETDVFRKGNYENHWLEIIKEIPYQDNVRHGVEKQVIIGRIRSPFDPQVIDASVRTEYYTWDGGNLTGPFRIESNGLVTIGFYYENAKEGREIAVDSNGKIVEERYFLNDMEVNRRDYSLLIREALVDQAGLPVPNVITDLIGNFL